MFTHRHNGGLIHGYFDRAECKAHDARLNYLGKFKSYRAAQLAITRAGKRARVGRPAMTFDRFAICAAYLALENDWNVGGQLRERPSNRRRRESVAAQLRRMGYRDGGRDGHSWETLKCDAERSIYVGALARFGMASMLSPKDETHAPIIAYIQSRQ